jgi:AcrR family transcriptional regulator
MLTSTTSRYSLMLSMSTYHHGELRSALLQAAAKVLEKQGVESIQLRDLARRAGVSHAAPYRHFTDRKALLAALAEEGYELLASELAGKAGAQMGEAYVAFALRNPERFRLMFGGRAPAGAASRRAYEMLAAALRARRDLPDPALAAAAAWSLVHGLAHLLLDGHFSQATGAAERERFVRSVLGAVRFAALPQRPE